MDIRLIAENIKYIRKCNNLNQEEFAEIIGITREQLSCYENAKVRKISAQVLSNIARKFSVDRNDLETKNLRLIKEA